MTQGTGNRSFSNKRSPRAARNKPSLVTSPDTEVSDSQEAQIEPETGTPEEELTPAPESAKSAAPSLARRLPRFFSTVGKSQQEQEASEEEIVQARLARAARSKPAAKAETTPDATETVQKVQAPAKLPPSRANAPARPASPFKTKYIIGMVVYLLGAQLLGGLVVSLFATYKLDALLTSFNLFGLPIVIKTSTLAFLIILVVLLVLLARLDLIPRSFSALGGTPSQRGGSSNRQNASDEPRAPQPTTRQGVSGTDDDLYQQYQSNRRRKK